MISCLTLRALILEAAAAALGFAQASPPNSPDQAAGVNYTQSQLTINLAKVSLGDVLAQIAQATGVKIDIPAKANTTLLPNVKLGPGPAGEVISSLLRDTHFNYIVQLSETDPLKIQSVLILSNDRNETPDPGDDPVRAARMGQTGAQVQAIQETGRAAASPPGKSEDATGGGSESASATDTAQSSTIPRAVPPVSSSPESGGLQARPGALSPPPVLSQDAISQQLQQMYQQREQMTQRSRSTGKQQL